MNRADSRIDSRYNGSLQSTPHDTKANRTSSSIPGSPMSTRIDNHLCVITGMSHRCSLQNSYGRVLDQTRRHTDGLECARLVHWFCRETERPKCPTASPFRFVGIGQWLISLMVKPPPRSYLGCSNDFVFCGLPCSFFYIGVICTDKQMLWAADLRPPINCQVGVIGKSGQCPIC